MSAIEELKKTRTPLAFYRNISALVKRDDDEKRFFEGVELHWSRHLSILKEVLLCSDYSILIARRDTSLGFDAQTVFGVRCFKNTGDAKNIYSTFELMVVPSKADAQIKLKSAFAFLEGDIIPVYARTFNASYLNVDKHAALKALYNKIVERAERFPEELNLLILKNSGKPHFHDALDNFREGLNN